MDNEQVLNAWRRKSRGVKYMQVGQEKDHDCFVFSSASILGFCIAPAPMVSRSFSTFLVL
jgi:hypothetical protein